MTLSYGWYGMVRSVWCSLTRSRFFFFLFFQLYNTFRWLDFSLFAFFSTEIAHNFFPEDDEDSLLKSFAIFGAAFLVRPVGGLLIGHAGDKHGRKKALSRALLFMAIPTTLMVSFCCCGAIR